MKKKQKIKIIISLLIIFVAILYVLPTFQVKIPKIIQKKLPKDKITLGLDLQGGMYVVLGVDLSRIKTEEEKRATILQALEIIRNRIDQFGVTEPSIQLQGKDRIIIQLPGVKDPNRAIELIGRVAKLEFKLVQEDAKKKEMIAKIDGFTQNNLSKNLYPMKKWENQLVIKEKDLVFVTNLLMQTQNMIDPNYEILLGKTEREEILVNGKTKLEMVSQIYLVEKEAKVTGADLKTAYPSRGVDPGDLSNYNKPTVHLEFDRNGAKKFAKVTEENKGKQLSICLDNKIYSAPVIREAIPHGNAQISGNFTDQEASDLAIVLRAGALPAPVTILQQDILGPSLGQDSIKDGVISAIIGCIFVIIFMLFYYRISGTIACFALCINTLIIIAILAMCKATLTLPGIAGIALTFGMAVDANIIIFERIREELRKGQTVLTAINTGYTKAFMTIFDSNVTTLIAAIILFEFGTGPIKGFAVTLSIGIITSMVTAIVGARIIFDLIAYKKGVTKLSI